jgi:hypothetical protein
VHAKEVSICARCIAAAASSAAILVKNAVYSRENAPGDPFRGLSAGGFALSLLARGTITARLDRNRVIARNGERQMSGAWIE